MMLIRSNKREASLNLIRESRKYSRRLTHNYSMVALAAIAVLAPQSILAHSPIDGTWKTDPDSSKASDQPVVFSVANGFYDCNTCVPKVHVKADGSDQSVAGLSQVSLAVKEINPHTIEIVMKKDGKTLSDQIRTASEDGQTLHVTNTLSEPSSPQPVIAESVGHRVGVAVPGANVTSGSWRTVKQSFSENGLLVTFKETAGGLSMTSPTGVSWKANFDGQYYPIQGNSNADSVSLRKLNDRTIEETFKQSGTIVRVNTITISADGKTMTTVTENKVAGRVSTWVATKQ
jgi:hypothetical protein